MGVLCTPENRRLYIEYRELIEFSQGSPLISSLYINNEKIGKEELFGGPFLLKKNYLYIPNMSEVMDVGIYFM